MKKKVLHVLSTSKYSGAENVACEIINLTSDVVDATYCSPKGKIEPILKSKNIKYKLIDKLNYSSLKDIINEEKPDIIHAHDIRASVLCSLFSSPQRKIISHVHCNHDDMTKTTLKAIIYKILSKRFEHIFWVSNSSLDNYKFKKHVLKRSSVLCNIINTNKVNETMKQDTNQYNYDVVFLGRLEEQKNPLRLVDVINIAKEEKPDIRLAIIGEGSLKEQLNQKINDLNLQENIKLLGSMNNPMKVVYDSKCMLMTSFREGTPMAVLEAMALGVPIVSTPVDGTKFLVDKYHEVGFISDNDEELAKQIVKLSSQTKNSKKKIIDIANKINDKQEYTKNILKIYNIKKK